MNRFADLLQTAICSALCEDGNDARGWLYLNTEPTAQELRIPTPLSYIFVCRALGLNWIELRESLREAIIFEKPHKRHLWLVHPSEPTYTGPCETNTNSNRISPSQKCKRKLHLSLVPPTERSSQLYPECEDPFPTVSDH